MYSHTGVCGRHGQLRVLTHICIIFCLSHTYVYIDFCLSIYIYARALTHTHTQAFADDTANFASAHLKAMIYCVETKERVEMIQV